MVGTEICITHWIPYVTICPETNLPELIFIKAHFSRFKELFEIRRRIAREIKRERKRYMEDIADDLLRAIPEADAIEVVLMFRKHRVKIYKR